MYDSPEFKSQCFPYSPTRLQDALYPPGGGGTTTAVASVVGTVLEHAVLKWLHQPELYIVTLAHSEDSWQSWIHFSRDGTVPGELVK